MWRKLGGFSVCMLLLFTSLIVGVGAAKDVSSADDYVDVPSWSIGDSWTFDVECDQSFDQHNCFQWSIRDLQFTVVGDFADSYRLDFVGNVTGEIKHFPFPKPIKKGTINGYEIVEKSNLGLSEIIAHVDGTTSLHHWPGEIPITIDMKIMFDPAFAPLSFPLYVGKNWVYNSSTVTIDYTISAFGMSESIHKVVIIEAGPASCTNKGNITVEAGTYEAFEVDVHWGLLKIYYAPKVANVIKISGVDPAQFTSIEMELTSTTYAPSGAPSKPDQPDGPTSGSAGEVYRYCTSTVDAEDDQVYYWFDWGGWNKQWLAWTIRFW